jgi:hypothetical protein
MSAESKAGQLSRRLLWFVALWLAGVGTVTVISLVLRFWIGRP